MTKQSNLMTPSSLALSLSAPRTPPYKSLERERLANGHPHLMLHPDFSDRITRKIGHMLSLDTQQKLRDTGSFRWWMDTIVAVTAPTLVLSHPSSASNFLKLSSRVELIPYGTHSMQRIHFWKPEDKKIPRGLLFFVHGGAWGSGHAWMYRLLALPFLDLGMAVAIVGYRNYPDANAAEQVADLNRAANELLRCKSDLIERIRHKSSSLGVCLAGHSSGAHIALWMLVDRVNHAGMEMSKGSKTTIKAEKLVFDSFIGLSGVYNIDDHFDYEASRGVEELSPMKPACGMTRDNFKSSSPGIRLARTLSVMEHNRNKNLPCVDQYMPRMLLLHGMKDTTVPFSSTAECARMLRSCGVTRYSEQYLGNADHGQTVLDLMRGGQTLDCVKSFLQDCESNPLIIKSKL